MEFSFSFLLGTGCDLMEVTSWSSLGETEANHDMPYRTAGASARIRREPLQNTNIRQDNTALVGYKTRQK
jgi:hypothetical protein